MAILKKKPKNNDLAKKRLRKRRKKLTTKQRLILGQKLKVTFEFPSLNLLNGKQRGPERTFNREYQGRLEEVKDDSPIERVALFMRNPEAPMPTFQKLVVLPWDFWEATIMQFRILQEKRREKQKRQREWLGS